MVDAPAATVPCVSYAPFRGSQSPFDENLVIAPEQIEADLRILSGLTGCVRIYSIDQGLAEVPAIAAGLGLEVLLGAWLSHDAQRNAKEISAVVALANAHPKTVRAVIVGNEVLLRREMPPDRLIAEIGKVQAAVEAPVSYADVWEFWLRHPEVADAVDLVTIHILPYWEDRPVAVENAAAHVGEVAERIRRAFPGKPILIGEAGWPSQGRMREEALPSPVNQVRFVREMLVLAAREGLAINLMEGIDQPWKRRLEGTVGGFWGMLDADRRTKFPLKGPVSGEPRWAAGAGASAALALLPFIWAAGRRAPPPGVAWLALAVSGPAAASLLVLAAFEVAAGSLGLLQWATGLVGLAIAATTVALAARLLLAGTLVLPMPALAIIERIRARRLAETAGVAGLLGWLRLATLFGIAATTLCLAFDGRYRDFPAAAYAPPVACFLALAWLGRGRARRPPGAREEAAFAAIAVAAAATVMAVEGLGNGQALAWTGVVLAAAVIPLLELWPLAGSNTHGPQCGEQEGGGSQIGIVEDERGGAAGSRRGHRPSA